jgi:hypothetical protein
MTVSCFFNKTYDICMVTHYKNILEQNLCCLIIQNSKMHMPSVFNPLLINIISEMWQADFYSHTTSLRLHVCHHLNAGDSFSHKLVNV